MTTGTSKSLSTLYTFLSVERIKRDITDIDDDKALNLILAFKPKTYYYKDQTRTQELQYGFIAQDLRKIFFRH